MELSHINKEGHAKMVDVTKKEDTLRTAIAEATIKMNKETLIRIIEGGLKKGDVLAVSQVAGIMAAKKTSELIPMCHPLNLSGINCDVEELHELPGFKLTVTAKLTGQTGVEMEALTGTSIGLLTIYDMVKAIDKGMIIRNVQLEEKSGGKSGDFKR